MVNELRNFLALSYDELEQMNLQAKEQRRNRVAMHKIQEERLKYLTDEKRIKAVTVLFSDLEGRLHMLDYDKKFLIKSWDNLTFDGSSIRGFTAQRESDLRLGIDWAAFYWGPADYFGAGKVLVFGDIIDKDGSPYVGDIRGVLKSYANGLHEKQGLTLNAANEIAVAAYLAGTIGFLEIARVVEQSIERAAVEGFVQSPTTIKDALALDKEGRRIAASLLGRRETV
jgi:glutamine synthetase